MGLAEVHLLDALQDEVVVSITSDAHDLENESVSARIVASRFVIGMDLIRNTRRVHKDTAICTEDETLAKSLALLIARHELVSQFLEDHHVPINHGQDEAVINDVAVPLSALVLSQDGLEEVSRARCTVCEAEALEDRWMTLLDGALGHTVYHVDVPLSVGIHAQLRDLALVQIYNVPSC